MVAMALMLIAIGLIFSQYRLPFESYKIKVATTLGDKKKYQAAGKLFSSVRENTPEKKEYLLNYGIVLLSAGNFNAAIKCFDQAKQFTSNPDLYMLTGECYLRLHRYAKSETEFQFAMLLQPQLFLPKVALMNLYHQTNDTVKAVYMANSILNQVPKVPSIKTNKYKTSARNLLIRLNQDVYAQPHLDFKRTAHQTTFK